VDGFPRASVAQNNRHVTQTTRSSREGAMALTSLDWFAYCDAASSRRPG
jgi:hypothetical protein